VVTEIEELQAMLDGMDLPTLRVRPPDVRWLSRNLFVRNSDHKNFEQAQKLLKALLKKGW